MSTRTITPEQETSHVAALLSRAIDAIDVADAALGDVLACSENDQTEPWAPVDALRLLTHASWVRRGLGMAQDRLAKVEYELHEQGHLAWSEADDE